MTTEITLQIPKELKRKLEERIKQTNFKSIQDYLLFVLEQTTSDVTTKQGYTKEEEEEMRGKTKWEKGHFEGKSYIKEEEEELMGDLRDEGYESEAYTEGEEIELQKDLEERGYL